MSSKKLSLRFIIHVYTRFFDELINADRMQKLDAQSYLFTKKALLQDSGDKQSRLLEAIFHEIKRNLPPLSESKSEEELKRISHIFLEAAKQLDLPLKNFEFPQPLSVLKHIGDSPLNSLETYPDTGLRCPFLFTAGKGNPSLLSELRKELSCVDHLDILVSFITWGGVRKIMDLLEQASAVDASGRSKTQIRILTTTYTGATEARAVEFLAGLSGVELKISLDGRRTRLHAKAWLFRRKTGYGTAYVGSANLSGAAMTGGLEWTLKLTQNRDPDVFERACAHFETLWNDHEFQAFDPKDQEQLKQLDEALKREGSQGNSTHYTPTWFSIQPKTYQLILMDQLKVERSHGRNRNLLVAATGTGKTVIAAFDYQRACKALGGNPRLLFVAHRKEILYQARATFAQVLRQPDFGEVLADGSSPRNYEHLFSTIQSFNSRNLLQAHGAEYWHMVIVDECHHSATKSYEDLLSNIKPSILLGLTATPERGDGKSILGFFDQRRDGRPSAELRLWDALEQELLSPFEYYGCHDDTDLSDVPWDKKSEETKSLDNIISGNHIRARVAIDAFMRTVTNPHKAKTLAFCVSVRHAQFMAEQFNKAGIKAEVIVGDQNITSDETRRKAPLRLSSGEVNVLCTCDLYNEGIDIPDVDTLLFLRPTQSSVVFQQQLGRGLRLADGKESCVVIDLVGRFRKDFRFDRLLGIMTGLPRQRLVEEVEKGFSHLPPGCHIQMDRIAKEQILETLKEACNSSWRNMTKELSSYVALAGTNHTSMNDFLNDTGYELFDLYSGAGNAPRGWTALKRKTGILRDPISDHEEAISSKMNNLINWNDPSLIKGIFQVAENPMGYQGPSSLVNILAAELFPAPKDSCTGEQLKSRLENEPHLCEEMKQLGELLLDRSEIMPEKFDGLPHDWPFLLHGRYGVRSIAIGAGKTAPDNRHFPREGVIRFQDLKIEILLVTLDKSSGFKETTTYHDYAISPEIFHWQSQNSASPDTGAGKRYCPGQSEGWKFMMFVRENKESLYAFLGEATSTKVEGSKPMSVTFTLPHPIPSQMFERFSVLRAV